jgi:hypothetical protein
MVRGNAFSRTHCMPGAAAALCFRFSLDAKEGTPLPATIGCNGVFAARGAETSILRREASESLGSL